MTTRNFSFADLMAMPRGMLMAVVVLASTAATIATPSARAQGFSAVISPPRFELNVQPGKTTRQVIEITHVANRRGEYRVYTNDWTIGADGNAVFTDELAPTSCRPWVALERRELALSANGKIRFRFEISPPANASLAECRFAIMIEGLEQVIKTEGALSFPVSGRVGVIVYAALGDARPALKISHAGVAANDGVIVPRVEVSNTGNAHGRLGGFVIAVDAKGNQFDLVPEAIPILPAQTRMVSLIPNVAVSGDNAIKYPLTVKGSLEWGDKKTDIDMRFEAPISQHPSSSATNAPTSPPAATNPGKK